MNRSYFRLTSALVLSCCLWFDSGCGEQSTGSAGRDPGATPPTVQMDGAGPQAPSSQSDVQATRTVTGRVVPENTANDIGTGDSDERTGLYDGPDLMGEIRREQEADSEYEEQSDYQEDPSFDDLNNTGSGRQERRPPAGDIPEEDSAPAQSGRVGGPLLQMPLIAQGTGGGSYPRAYCGPTSVRMVLAHYGIQKEADEVALGKFGPGTPMYRVGQGSTHEGMATALKHYGLNAELDYGKNLSQIRAAIDKGHPVIINVKGNYGPFYTNGHIMVVVGFDANGNPIVNDPAGGVRRVINKRTFLNCWQGLMIETWK